VAAVQEQSRGPFRAVNALKLSPATEDDSVLKAWSVLCEKSNRQQDSIALKSVPLGFASKRWRALLQHPMDPTLIDCRQLEIACCPTWPTIFKPNLQAGNVFVSGSEAFADHRAERWLYLDLTAFRFHTDTKPIQSVS
jgi:hypothetical protein